MKLRDKIGGIFFATGLAASIIAVPFGLTYITKRLYREFHPTPKVARLNYIDRKTYRLNSIENEIFGIEKETRDMSVPLNLGDYHTIFQKGKDALQKERDELMLEKKVIEETKRSEYYKKKADYWSKIVTFSFLSMLSGLGIALLGKQNSKEEKRSGGGTGVAG